MLKKVFLIVFLNLQFGFLSHSQKLDLLALNRVYLNSSFNVRKHTNVGIYAHLFDHFSAGFMYSSSDVLVEKTYNFIYPSSKLYDKFKSYNLLFGVTTCRKKKLDFDVLIGPSYMNSETNTYVYLYQNPQIQSQEYYKSTKVYDTEFGVIARANLNLQIKKAFGFNVSVQNIFTPSHSVFSFIIGINIGIVQDWDNL